MEWAIRKKGLPEVIVQVVMILYCDAKTKVKVGSHLSEKILVQVGVHQGTVFLQVRFAIVVNVITENAREMKFCMQMTCC